MNCSRRSRATNNSLHLSPPTPKPPSSPRRIFARARPIHTRQNRPLHAPLARQHPAPGHCSHPVIFNPANRLLFAHTFYVIPVPPVNAPQTLTAPRKHYISSSHSASNSTLPSPETPTAGSTSRGGSPNVMSMRSGGYWYTATVNQEFFEVNEFDYTIPDEIVALSELYV